MGFGGKFLLDTPNYQGAHIQKTGPLPQGSLPGPKSDFPSKPVQPVVLDPLGVLPG